MTKEENDGRYEFYELEFDRRTKEGRALYNFLKTLPYVKVIEDKPTRPKTKKTPKSK